MSEKPLTNEPLPESLKFLKPYLNKPAIASALPGLLQLPPGQQEQIHQDFLHYKRGAYFRKPTPVEVEASRLAQKRIEAHACFPAMAKDPRYAKFRDAWNQAGIDYDRVADERGWGVLDPDYLAPEERALLDACELRSVEGYLPGVAMQVAFCDAVNRKAVPLATLAAAFAAAALVTAILEAFFGAAAYA